MRSTFALNLALLISMPAMASQPLSTVDLHDIETGIAKQAAAAGMDLASLAGDALPGPDVCAKDYVPDATTESGHKIKMLGAALVYWTPVMGRAVMGHLSERYNFCRDTQYFDVAYNYGPFDKSKWDDGSFQSLYNVTSDSFTPEQQKNLFDSIFVDINYDPPAEYSASQFAADQTIYEAWFKVDGATMYQMLSANVSRYEDQMAQVQAHQPLPPYKIPSDDCITPVAQDYDKLVNPGYIGKNSPAKLTPGFFYNAVKGTKVDHIIMYPSQRQFRLLEMKAEGKSTAFQWFMPTSQVAAGYPDSWALIFPGTKHGLLRYLVISPLAGATNLLAAVGETIFGIVTTPVTLVGMITGDKALESDEFGIHRFERGISDMMASTFEMASLELRYPQSTDWTPEERSFIQSYAQNSALLEYLNVKYDDAPLVVKKQN